MVPDILAFDDNGPPTQNVGTAARSDYEVVGGVSYVPSGTADLHKVRFAAWGEPTYRPGTGIAIAYRTARLRDIIGGLSKTILFAERAGRPDWYRRGMPVEPYPYSNPEEGMDNHQAAWGISTHFWWLVFWHEQTVNENNVSGIYSFHSSGANVALADGSVRFLSDGTETSTLNALVTRSAGDIVTLK